MLTKTETFQRNGSRFGGHLPSCDPASWPPLCRVPVHNRLFNLCSKCLTPFRLGVYPSSTNMTSWWQHTCKPLVRVWECVPQKLISGTLEAGFMAMIYLSGTARPHALMQHAEMRWSCPHCSLDAYEIPGQSIKAEHKCDNDCKQILYKCRTMTAFSSSDTTTTRTTRYARDMRQTS
jgi:hypothetical protein